MHLKVAVKSGTCEMLSSDDRIVFCGAGEANVVCLDAAARDAVLTFKNRASYIWDGRTATLQMLHFIYFFNKYKY